MPSPFRSSLPACLAGLWVAACGLCLAPAIRAEEAGPAPSFDAPVAAVADAADEPGQTAFTPTRRRAGSPFAAGLRDAERAHADALAELRAQLDAASRAERPALQRRIEALKRARAAGLLELQLGEARRRGRAPLAERIERRLARLSAAGVARPASPAGGGR